VISFAKLRKRVDGNGSVDGECFWFRGREDLSSTSFARRTGMASAFQVKEDASSNTSLIDDGVVVDITTGAKHRVALWRSARIRFIIKLGWMPHAATITGDHFEALETIVTTCVCVFFFSPARSNTDFTGPSKIQESLGGWS